MDLNFEYAAHQQELMFAESAANDALRQTHLDNADAIAGRIGTFQKSLGAAAACAWSSSQFATS